MRKRLSRNQRRLLDTLAQMRPRCADGLHQFVTSVLSLTLPRVARVAGHSAPFEYLRRAFFEEEGKVGGCDSGDGGGCAEGGARDDCDERAKPQAAGASAPGGDVIVWANRGGGKTMLGAAATALDLLFKPGVQVRILGGSLAQSSRMYEYLLTLMDRPGLRGVVAGAPTRRRLTLINGSAVEILTASQRSVRGVHVHKLRCDEVDQFDPDIWRAAQFVTRSSACGGVFVRGAVEAMSTMHRPFGPMSKLVDDAAKHDRSRLLKWSVIDVLERCPPARDCAACPLEPDCQGAAKQGDGFVLIDDAIRQRHRADDDTWAAEMLCRRPKRDMQVYPRFDPTVGGRHVLPSRMGVGGPVLVSAFRSARGTFPEDYKIRRELLASGSRLPEPDVVELVGGMDFGIRNPTVMLWAHLRALPVDEDDDARGDAHRVANDGVNDSDTITLPPGEDPSHPRNLLIEIVDEYVKDGLTLEQNMAEIEARGWPRPAWLGVDPAGGSRNSQTGVSDIQYLRQRGYRVRHRRTTLTDGIARLRRRLERRLLRISPHCQRLIEALGEYHYDPDHPRDETPVKDGHDHCCDALRYLVINLEVGAGGVKVRGY